MAYQKIIVQITLQEPFNQNGNVLNVMNLLRNTLEHNNQVKSVKLYKLIKE